jgi:hypothetical protein
MIVGVALYVGNKTGALATFPFAGTLAQADELLSGAVRDVMGDAAQAGWLRRRIQGRLLEVVREYTLARFREEGVKHGGINLLGLRVF